MPRKIDPRIEKVLKLILTKGKSVPDALAKHGNPCSAENINKHLRKRRADASDPAATAECAGSICLGPQQKPTGARKRKPKPQGRRARGEPKQTSRQVQQRHVAAKEKNRRFSEAFKEATQSYAKSRKADQSTSAEECCKAAAAAHGLSPGSAPGPIVCASM